MLEKIKILNFQLLHFFLILIFSVSLCKILKNSGVVDRPMPELMRTCRPPRYFMDYEEGQGKA